MLCKYLAFKYINNTTGSSKVPLYSVSSFLFPLMVNRLLKCLETFVSGQILFRSFPHLLPVRKLIFLLHAFFLSSLCFMISARLTKLIITKIHYIQYCTQLSCSGGVYYFLKLLLNLGTRYFTTMTMDYTLLQDPTLHCHNLRSNMAASKYFGFRKK